MGRRNDVPELILKDMQDPLVSENFFRIQNFLQEFPLFFGQWSFFELVFTGAVTNKKIPHGLTFRPKDILQTGKFGTGSVTFNFDEFDSTNIDVTTTGACTVRAFVGLYKEN